MSFSEIQAKREAILFLFGCSEVNSTYIITSGLANERAPKALFTCVVSTKYEYLTFMESKESKDMHYNLLTAYLSWIQIARYFEFDPRTLTVTDKWTSIFPGKTSLYTAPSCLSLFTFQDVCSTPYYPIECLPKGVEPLTLNHQTIRDSWLRPSFLWVMKKFYIPRPRVRQFLTAQTFRRSSLVWKCNPIVDLEF